MNSTTFKMGNLGGGGSLVIQGLRIYLSMQGDADLIPAQGTKIYKLGGAAKKVKLLTVS